MFISVNDIEMKNIKLLLLLPMLAAALISGMVSCMGSTNYDDELSEATSAIEQGDYATAQSICDNLYKKKSSAQTASQLGRLSILFMDLSNAAETDKQSDNIMAAVQCYLSAYDLNPDSAMLFYESLYAIDNDRAEALGIIARGMTGQRPVEISDVEPSDSLISADSLINE